MPIAVNTTSQNAVLLNIVTKRTKLVVILNLFYYNSLIKNSSQRL